MPNASIPTPQPVLYRPMFGSFGGATAATSVTFVSQASIESGNLAPLYLKKQPVPVMNCRNIGKADLIRNDAMPHIEIDPETYEVRADGELLTWRTCRSAPDGPAVFSILVPCQSKSVVISPNHRLKPVARN